VSRQRPILAVVGGGVAGIVASHLLQRRYQVTLFEAGSYLGGHTNTVLIESGPDEGLAVDTGFIVFNLQTYPNFVRFLRELGVEWQDSDMSFGYECAESRWVYGGHDLKCFFAERANLFQPRFWKFAWELLRLNWLGTKFALTGLARDLTLREFLRPFSSDLVRHYVEPIGASIWSTPTQDVLDYPALSFFRFFHNHGLMKLWNRPQWLTVRGGSHQYVKSFQRHFQGQVLLNHPVNAVLPQEDGTFEVVSPRGRESFDAVVMATHADVSLRLLPQATAEQRRLLGPWRYLENTATLHGDTRLLPSNPRARSSWNYRRQANQCVPCLTYDMNRLQRLSTPRPYLVSLNGDEQIDESQVIGQWRYHHPQYDLPSMATQESLPSLNSNGIAFCGSYHGYGFHEDATRSAVKAAESLGVRW
jgi:predicted NAD/FAD-binding protein